MGAFFLKVHNYNSSSLPTPRLRCAGEIIKPSLPHRVIGQAALSSSPTLTFTKVYGSFVPWADVVTSFWLVKCLEDEFWVFRYRDFSWFLVICEKAHSDVILDDVILEETESTKILGMYLDQGLTLVCAKVS